MDMAVLGILRVCWCTQVLFAFECALIITLHHCISGDWMFNLRQGQGSLTKKVAPAGVMGNATRLCGFTALRKVETFAGQFVDGEPRGEGNKFKNN